ncbi:hypothetical protein Agub_g6905, partial [Astrephomene gubernaculifera]
MAQHQEARSYQESQARIWQHLQPELSEHIISFLSPNEIACTVRLINKAAAAQFGGAHLATVHLSSPVPTHAFKQHWCRPGAMRVLTLKQRQQLLCLTARSGSIPNLELVVAATGLFPVGSWTKEPGPVALAAAAEQLDAYQWLLQRGYTADGALVAAAAAGKQVVCEELLAKGCCWDFSAVYAAARGGHVGLMEWLLHQRPEQELWLQGYVDSPVVELMGAAILGCNLEAVHNLVDLLHRRSHCPVGFMAELDQLHQHMITRAATRSLTPDWQAKVMWLETLGFPKFRHCLEGAAGCPDALERLRWLHGRGYPFSSSVVQTAVDHGNLEALEYLLGEAIEDLTFGCESACERGFLAALTFLHARGYVFDPEHVVHAAAGGQLAVVAWLVDELGEELAAADPRGPLLNARVFTAAACSGNMELLRWLRERGCPWNEKTSTQAAAAGCEEALEWLVEQGCPWP